MDSLLKAEIPHFKRNLFLAAVSIGIWKFYQGKRARKLSAAPEILNIREALFFRNKGKECFDHLNKAPCKLERYCPAYCLRMMLDYLASATESIDVCILHLTLDTIEKVLLKAHSVGVKIRIISDYEMSTEKSRVPYLSKRGIPVKMRKKFYYQMHNKFVILDGKILMTGSLNWTLQGICGNWDNLMITSDPRLVSQYHWEFEDLWHFI